MIALSIALIAWAGVFAFWAWAWRDVRLAQIAEARAERDKLMERTEAQFDRLQTMIARWSRAAAPPTTPPLRSDNLVRPSFGQKKPDSDGGDAA